MKALHIDDAFLDFSDRSRLMLWECFIICLQHSIRPKLSPASLELAIGDLYIIYYVSLCLAPMHFYRTSRLFLSLGSVA